MYLLLFALWLILNGNVTVEICLFGVLIVSALALLAYALFGYTPKKDLRVLRRVPLFLIYLPVLLFEIIRANFRVLGMILRPKMDARPALVVVETGLRSRAAQYVMANSITLTPGTITVRTAGGRMTVHCLRRDMIEGIENGTLCRLLRRMEA